MFFDFETGGLDPKRNPILQAAWIIEKDGTVVSERCYDVKPEQNAEFTLEALDVNNITLDRMRAGKELSYVLSAMIQDARAVMEGSSLIRLCGHNVHFDINFLATACDRFREPLRQHIDLSSSLDTCAIARFLSYLGMIKVRNHKLVTLAEYFEIPINAHDALGDVLATRCIFHRFEKIIEKIKPSMFTDKNAAFRDGFNKACEVNK